MKGCGNKEQNGQRRVVCVCGGPKKTKGPFSRHARYVSVCVNVSARLCMLRACVVLWVLARRCWCGRAGGRCGAVFPFCPPFPPPLFFSSATFPFFFSNQTLKRGRARPYAWTLTGAPFALGARPRARARVPAGRRGLALLFSNASSLPSPPRGVAKGGWVVGCARPLRAEHQSHAARPPRQPPSRGTEGVFFGCACACVCVWVGRPGLPPLPARVCARPEATTPGGHLSSKRLGAGGI